VLHDDLVPQEILGLCPQSAQIVNVGKRCGRHGRSQEQINTLMIWHARETQCETIVRLKSGDPAIFGRLGEEIDALQRANIEFEIVPGITAAAGAAAAAGITLTDRRSASALVFVTAHRCGSESLKQTLFDPAHATYALYMPGPDYARTAQELIESGLAAATPCTLISNAGRANQEQHLLTVSELASLSRVAPPAILIVGEVARRACEQRKKNVDAPLVSALEQVHGRPTQQP
jgi:uroporphyrin-III C-methyltransferase